jgi:SAM-dependent methyltransferase
MFTGLKNALLARISPKGAQPSVAVTAPTSIDDMVPDPGVASYVGGGDAEAFKQVGREVLWRLQEYGGLQPHERVLEVGSGIGRIAIPLTQYLHEGRYVGFDIVKHGIDWCRERITTRYPGFTFFHSDIYNKAYNPEGLQAAHEYAFPFPDRSFDFVFLTSVFTHMLPRDVERYVSEIARVLAGGGRCFCTAYLVDDEGRGYLDRRESLKAFVDCGGYFTDCPEVPEAAVAYDQEYLFGLFRSAGMEIRRIVPGEWWKNQTAQDAFVAQKQG